MSDDANHVTVTDENGLVVELWRGPRKVTLDVHLDGRPAEYTKVWGPDLDTEMETGTVGVEATAEALFAWLAA